MTVLREALAARPDRDFVVSAPARRPAATRRAAPSRRAPTKKNKAGIVVRVLASVARNPFRVLVTLVLSGCAGMIAWNALVLQEARHPAPLFNHPGVAPEAVMPAPPARAVAAPQAPAAPIPSLIDPAPTATTAPPVPPARNAITDLIRSNGESAPAATRAQPNPAPSAVKAPPTRDPIAEMIRMGGAVPTPPANVGRTDSADPVVAVQRALAKLGYPVKPDGMMGGETRAALERFEQDRHLPVTGEFTARTLRDLSVASGIAIPQ
jgi:hypothetical protein